MALVSISEASRLTGKSRTTIQAYIKQGKLTRCTDDDNKPKIDTSELLRVFGAFTVQQLSNDQLNTTGQHLAGHTVQIDDQFLQQENQKLKAEIELVKTVLREKEMLLAEKDKRNDDLKQALLLIESKLPTTPEPTKKPWQFWKK